MTTVKKLRLKDIVKKPLDINELNQLRGGVVIMPLAYGCTNDICISALNPKYCDNVDANICKESVCTSGVGPSV